MNAALCPADMTNLRTVEAAYNDWPLPQILAEFRVRRTALVARLGVLDDSARERTALHPRPGRPMRVLDLMLFASEHDDHHLARISEILEAPRPVS